MDAIFHRTSIRKYQETPVEAEKIETLLRAAMAAPSACNQQPWEFYVVRNKEKIKELSEASPYAGCAKGAPVVFVPCYRKNCQVPMYAEIDLSAAVENLLLEADSLGLGAVWMALHLRRTVWLTCGRSWIFLGSWSPSLSFPAATRPRSELRRIAMRWSGSTM